MARTDLTRSGLFAKPAAEVIQQLRTGYLSLEDLYDAVEARINDLDGRLNAVPTQCFDAARTRLKSQANLIDLPLAGMPLLVKDLTDTKGVRTTYGSPIFTDHVPSKNDLLIERLEALGAVVIGKTNTPEFGAGANTFNDVLGTTVNPYNHALTCGGSSGGSAVALAAGMSWFATGSDYGGSLRIPAAFCGVYGLRPSIGVIPQGSLQRPANNPLNDRSTEGPMAANLQDLSLLFEAMAGADPRDPRSGRPLLEASPKKKRVAVLEDFGDIIPITAENKKSVREAAEKLSGQGYEVVRSGLDLAGVRDAFQAIRAFDFAAKMGALLAQKRDQLKPEVIWNIEAGLTLTAADIAKAVNRRGRLTHDLIALFDECDALLAPVTAVRPFPVTQRYVDEIDGQKLDNYVDWLAPTFLFSLWIGPSMSVPMGFGADKLPNAVQLIGGVAQERRLFGVADSLR